MTRSRSGLLEDKGLRPPWEHLTLVIFIYVGSSLSVPANVRVRALALRFG